MSSLFSAALSMSRTLRRLCDDQNGAIYLTTALALVTLSGFAGLGLEVAAWQSSKQKMQTAADAAAVAGARELVKASHTDAQVTDAAVADAATNGFAAGAGRTVDVVLRPDGVSVEVTLSATAPRYFSQLLVQTPVVIGVRAAGGVLGGSPACLLALDPTGPQALMLDSNAVIDVHGCSVHVNSSHASQALQADSNSTVAADDICVGGGYSGAQASFSPLPTTGCAPLADPLADLDPPPYGGCDHTNRTINSNQTVTLDPGVYCGGLRVGSNATVTLNPGVYVIKDGSLNTDSNSTITALGVGFYLTGATALLDFDSNSVLTLQAPTSGPMAGLAIFQDRAFGGTHEIDSNASNMIEGAIYLPNGTLDNDSNAALGGASPCLAVIAYQVHFDSNAGMAFTYDPAACSVPMPAGLGGTRVALIE